MRLGPGEPDAGPWRVLPTTEVLELLGRPRVVAVDGRTRSRPGSARGERAQLIVSGAPELPHDRRRELVVPAPPT